MTRNQIDQIIFAAIKMANHAREDHEQIPVGPDTELYGSNGHLDSMGLVAFLIDIEESMQDEGLRISLSDERAMSQVNSPFRNVQTLSDYVLQLVAETKPS